MGFPAPRKGSPALPVAGWFVPCARSWGVLGVSCAIRALQHGTGGIFSTHDCRRGQCRLGGWCDSGVKMVLKMDGQRRTDTDTPSRKIAKKALETKAIHRNFFVSTCSSIG